MSTRPQIKVKAMASSATPKARPRVKPHVVKKQAVSTVTGSGKRTLTPIARQAMAHSGNDHKFRGKLIKQALLNALKKEGRGDTMAALEALGSKMIRLGLLGSVPAFREVADRIDGKPAQMIIGDPEQPITFKNVSEMSDSELEVLARGHLIQGDVRRV